MSIWSPGNLFYGTLHHLLSGEATLSYLFSSPPEAGSTLKEKTLFRRELGWRKANRKSQKLSLLYNTYVWQKIYQVYPVLLTHCRLNELAHTIYWKILLSIWGMSDCDLDVPRENCFNYLQTVKTLIRCCVLWHLIWVNTVCQLPFYGFPDYNWLKCLLNCKLCRSWSDCSFLGDTLFGWIIIVQFSLFGWIILVQFSLIKTDT